MTKNTFSAYRLKKESISRLQQIKIAYEAVADKKVTNDEFVAHLINCLESSDPKVMDYYNQAEALKSSLSKTTNQ